MGKKIRKVHAAPPQKAEPLNTDALAADLVRRGLASPAILQHPVLGSRPSGPRWWDLR